MESRLHAILLRGVPVGSTFFEEFVKECRAWYEQPAHSMTELRTRLNTKLRGDIFEEFCVLYMKHVRGYSQVWRLEDVPDDILGGLGLKRQDMGIDLICERNGRYTAVQCKYKKHSGTKSKTIVTWSQLSTFYALVLRTGPWETYAVMTNCDYVRHMGKKTPKDLSICVKTFKRITSEQWTQMCGLEGHRMTEAPKPAVLSLDQLRAARLARFTATAPVETNAHRVYDTSGSEARLD